MTEKFVRRELLPITPTEAIAEAMVWAYAQNFKKAFPLQERPKLGQSLTIPHPPLNYLTAERTRGLCEWNCLLVIYHLRQRYPDHFRHLAILKSVKDPNHRPFKNPKWGYHIYFLAQNKDNIYQAGSPANFSIRKPGRGSSLERLFSSQDLAKILKRITLFDGGTWPSDAAIKHAISFLEPVKIDNDPDYTNYKQIYFPTIFHEGGQDNSVYQSYQIPCLPDGEFINPI